MSWYGESTVAEKRTFWSCFAWWALDGVDTQMFSLLIPSLLVTWGLGTSQAGLISGTTLVTGALGGWIAGVMCDRLGRVKTLQITVVWFSCFTFLSVFAQNYEQLLVLKPLQGLGFGGEWTAGAVLVSETLRARHRGKAMGIVQSAWGFEWGGAVILNVLAFSSMDVDLAWRVLLGIGALPALLVLYIRRHIVEPQPLARTLSQAREHAPASNLFDPRVLRVTVVGTLIGTGAHSGYHAITTWLPTYLKTERNLSVLSTGGYLAVIVFAFICGCFLSACLQDRLGLPKTQRREPVGADELRHNGPVAVESAAAGDPRLHAH